MATKGETTYITYDAVLEWAKVFEFNRDMGSPEYPKEETNGEYQLTTIVDEETKAKMIAAGIPEVSMGWPQFKPAEDGKFAYRTKRPHQSKWLKERDGSPVVLGPPEVFFFNESVAKMKAEGGDTIEPYIVHHNPDVDGLISNGSEAKVKLSIYSQGSKRIIQLQRVALTSLIPYFDQAANNSAVDEATGIAI